MNKSKATSRPFEQTAQQRAEIDALRRMLNLSEGTFSLSVAICNSPALRDHIIEHVMSEIEGIEVVRIPEDAQDIFDFVRRQMPNGQARAVFIVDTEKALTGDKRDRVLQGLNVSREQWRSICKCPIVFWLPEYVMELLMTHARDLWSWVSHNFEFVSEQATALAGQQDSFAGDLTLAGNLDVHEKHFRIAELEQRIADIGEQPKEQLTEHALVWLNELAYLYKSLGELDKAEKMRNKELEISQKLGRLEGMADACGNLGVIYQTRGDLDGAVKMYVEVLEIEQKLGRPGSIANAYGNLGLIYRTRGDLDEAERMLNKSLEINQRLGRLEGMANAYGNLGVLCQMRGDLDGAEKMHNKGLEINQRLGRLEGMATDYGNLGLIHRTRGDLDGAEKMLNKALETDQKLGESEGVGIQYGNLGLIYQQRGNLAQAREFWEKALALFQKIGAKDRTRTVQAWIDNLQKDRE
jgi:tetratricopeptide (TPR) repeat protein